MDRVQKILLKNTKSLNCVMCNMLVSCVIRKCLSSETAVVRKMLCWEHSTWRQHIDKKIIFQNESLLKFLSQSRNAFWEIRYFSILPFQAQKSSLIIQNDLSTKKTVLTNISVKSFNKLQTVEFETFTFSKLKCRPVVLTSKSTKSKLYAHLLQSLTSAIHQQLRILLILGPVP